jgi:hypothetical protein
VLPVQANTAKVYVWRNEVGVLVFSDSPKPGAEEIDVKDKSNSMPSINTSILDITPKTLSDDFEVEIVQPENNATVRDNTGSVYIAGRIKPLFKQGFTIELNLDGKPYDKPQPQAMFVLRNVERGEHQVKMHLRNNTGKIIASSKPITFYMHRASSQGGAR